jgi:hypothetical protein
MMCSNDPITNWGNQEYAHWAHNSQYKYKQTYTIHSTKTNKHTQYTVRRQTNIHNTQYEDKQTYTTQHRKLNRWATLNVTKPRGMKNGNPSGTNQTVRRQTKQKYATQNRKLKSYASLTLSKTD